jgi:hypothetical protein
MRGQCASVKQENKIGWQPTGRHEIASHQNAACRAQAAGAAWQSSRSWYPLGARGARALIYGLPDSIVGRLKARIATTVAMAAARADPASRGVGPARGRSRIEAAALAAIEAAHAAFLSSRIGKSAAILNRTKAEGLWLEILRCMLVTIVGTR